MSLYKKFKEEIRKELKEKLGKKNIHEVPQIDKIIVSMGIGSLVTRKGIKDFSDLEKNLATITGQKPVVVRAKRSVSNFKLREGMPVMLKVTLRGKRAYDFIDRMVKLYLPRVRDFKGISPRKFDGFGNYNYAFLNQTVFPEINPDDIKTPMGVQVNIVTTTDSDEEAKTLMESLGFIFEK
jgi:large subunit ribosomal protein L5